MRFFLISNKGKLSFWTAVVFMVLFLQGNVASVCLPDAEAQEAQTKKLAQLPTMLLTNSDLYCSFLVQDDRNFPIKITGAERDDEKSLFSDGDLLYINRGQEYGLTEGQSFLVVHLEKRLRSPYNRRKSGYLVLKKGRVILVDVGDGASAVRVDQACDPVEIGDHLIPYVEQAEREGVDLGYDAPRQELGSVRGRIIYVHGDIKNLGTGYWGLIDLGSEDGISTGEQMLIFRKKEMELIFGNLVVIDAQPKISTIKVLACKDVAKEGDWVAVRNR